MLSRSRGRGSIALLGGFGAVCEIKPVATLTLSDAAAQEKSQFRRS